MSVLETISDKVFNIFLFGMETTSAEVFNILYSAWKFAFSPLSVPEEVRLEPWEKTSRTFHGYICYFR